VLGACAIGLFSGFRTGSTASDTIAIGTPYAPTTLDPQVGTSGGDYAYLYFVFDRLIQQNPKTGVLEPMLATSWNFVGAKKLALDVNLRRGVTFQDGTPFNADAVIATFKRQKAKGDVLNNLQYVKGYRKLSQYKVRILLSQENAQLPYGLADRAGMIFSPTALKKVGDKNFGNQPVGAGPYRFTSQKTGAEYNFTRYDGYWNDKAPNRVRRVKNIKYVVFKTDSAEVAAVRSGQIQIGSVLYPQDVASLRKDTKLTTTVGPNSTFSMIYFNGKLKPFDDPRVRLAVNHALDRQAILKAASEGLGQVWYQPVPPNTFGYAKGLGPLWPRDVAKAKQLMAQAGYADGVDVECYTYPGLGYEITAPIIVENMKEIGLNLKVVTGTPAQVVPFYTQDLSPCYLSGWTGGPNPAVTYRGILWSKSYYNAGKTNFGVDKPIEAIQRTYSRKAQEALYVAINKAMKRAPGYAPLYAAASVTAYAKNVKGWVISPFPLLNTSYQGLYYGS